MIRIGLFAFSLVVFVSGAADAGTFTRFKVEGAHNTTATGINASGTVVGAYELDHQREAGFVRAPDGTITTFSAAGLESTIPAAINGGGTIVGYSGQQQSFVRKPDGSVEVFQVDGARWTTATAINDAGYVAGTYSREDHSSGSFLRAPDGTITLISASQDLTTSVYGLNNANAMVGQLGFGSTPTGFIYADGNVATVDSSSITAINPQGSVAGVLLTEASARGFTRGPNGQVKPFGPKVEDMEVAHIDVAGNVAGTYLDRHSFYHGFVYSKTAGFTKIDDPKAGHKQPFAGTQVLATNDAGVAVGISVNNGYRRTAFIWVP